MKIVNLIEDTKGENSCLFEHGLSFYIETANHKLLVDTGATNSFLENAKSLGIDLKSVDTVIISHGHYDHAGGVLGFSEINKNATIYIQEKATKGYYRMLTNGQKYIGIDEKIKNLPNVKLINGDLKIDDELYLFTNITKRELWPKGNLQLKRKDDENYVQDDFDHEQYLVISQNNKNYLLSGCAHNGITNIIDKYIEIYGKEPDVVISGFHMVQKDEYSGEDIAVIKEIANKLKTYNTKFYTGHCTGDEAFEIMKPILKDKLVKLHSGQIIE